VQPDVVLVPVLGLIGQVGNVNERQLERMFQDVLGDHGVEDLVPVSQRGVIQVANLDERGGQQPQAQHQPRGRDEVRRDAGP
jgi:hypothetical protein